MKRQRIRWSLGQPGSQPLVFKSLDTRVICHQLFRLVNHAVPISSLIVFHISFLSITDFYMGTVWVWRMEIWNGHQISICTRRVHTQSFLQASSCMFLGFVRVHRWVPTFSDCRLSWINLVVSFVVERNCLETTFDLFYIRTRSDLIIMKELRSCSFLSQTF